jgi:hypothetical protein
MRVVCFLLPCPSIKLVFFVLFSGPQQRAGSRGAAVDFRRAGRASARRSVRGHPQGRRRSLQSHQQTRPRISEKDPGQGHSLPTHGEHSKAGDFCIRGTTIF